MKILLFILLVNVSAATHTNPGVYERWCGWEFQEIYALDKDGRSVSGAPLVVYRSAQDAAFIKKVAKEEGVVKEELCTDYKFS